MHINVLYSTDENYVRHAGASILSLLENNVHVDKISIYIIDDGITSASKNKLISITESFKRVINIIPIQSVFDGISKKDDFPLSGYGRLFISNVIEGEKVLYIDCDTIINNSIEELWNTDINEYFVAGVLDNPARYMVEVIGMDNKDRYINSGVLLINLKKWRENNLEQKYVDFMEKYNGKVPHHDQGVINGVCKEAILILEPKFNMMPQFNMYTSKQIQSLYDISNYYSQQQLKESIDHPVIVHYISKFYNRPWFHDCTHPNKDFYTHYLSKTDWEIKFETTSLNKKVKFRKWVFENMPFPVFCALERVLDIKRKNNIRKNYSYLNILK